MHLGSSLLNQGLNPGPLHWECEVLSIGSPGMSQGSHFKSKPSTGLRFSCQHTGIKIYIMVYWVSLVAQTIKHLPTKQETRGQPLGREDLLEKETAPHSSILAWRIPWTEEPGRLQSMGIAESDTTECLTPLNPHSFPSFPCLNNSFAWICPSEGLNSVVEVTSLGSWFNLALLPPAVQSLLRPHQGPLSSVPG